MRIQQTGAVADGLYVLGDAGIPAYLVMGDRPTVVDAGFSFMGSVYARQLADLVGDAGPARLLLTHSHYDHAGATAYLKGVFPSMTVAGSALVDSVFERPNAIATIGRLTEAAYGLLLTQADDPPEYIPFEPVPLDRALADGDTLPLSDGSPVQVIETPGHTRDCLSFYVPDKKLLFTSEAAGIPDHTGYVYYDFLADYDAFVASLKKLEPLETEIICFGHGYVYTQEDAHGYITRAISECQAFYDRVLDLLRQKGGDTLCVMNLIRAEEYDPKPHPKQPEPAYLLNLEARVNRVKESARARGLPGV